MALKELVKKAAPAKPVMVEKKEVKVQEFISQGGTLAGETLSPRIETEDHRLTLRIPQWLMAKIDEKRKKRVGSISRNLLILEILEKAMKNS